MNFKRLGSVLLMFIRVQSGYKYCFFEGWEPDWHSKGLEIKSGPKLTYAGLNLQPIIRNRKIYNFLIFNSLCSAFLWSFNSFLVPLKSHLSHGNWGLCSVLLCLLNTVILSVWYSHSSHWCVTWWTVFLCSLSAGFVPRKLHSAQGSRVTYLSCSWTNGYTYKIYFYFIIFLSNFTSYSVGSNHMTKIEGRTWRINPFPPVNINI